MSPPALLRSLLLAGLFLLSALGARAANYTLSLPSYLGRPGALVPMPLNLSDASGVAGVTVKINFDPALLSVASITPGTLGAEFTLDQSVADGVITLIFTRTENLPAGSGRLAAIQFQVNPGASDALFSDLAIAEFALADSTGVIDLMGGAHTVTTTSGKLTVNSHGFIDNDQDKLPDPWETTHGLGLLTDNRLGDEDADGLSNLLEYAFGLRPLQADASPQISGSVELDGRTYLTIAFPRLAGAQSGLAYSVRESTDLSSWENVTLGANTTATVNHGDGTETLTVRGNLPVSGPDAVSRAFLQLLVTPVPVP